MEQTDLKAGRQVILGLWDGHDAGAALINGGEIVFAVNEERLSRRKLEVGFPRRSIEHCLARAKKIDLVSISTTDPAKTLSRAFPSLREEYYLLRRRKRAPGFAAQLKKRSKYAITGFPPLSFTEKLSRRALARDLEAAGLAGIPLEFTGHHASHAAAAAACSGFNQCLAVTLDGVGDGLSGTFWLLKDGALKLLRRISARHSFGIFFEHVTNLLNMRELEDEGKVMALAAYAAPVPDSENPLLDLFSTAGGELRCRCGPVVLYNELKRIHWRFPAEQFAYMAQRTLEVHVVALLREMIRTSSQRSVAYAGGVAANVKINMLLADLPEIENLFIFPHMGDGGLAAGSALWSFHSRSSWTGNKLKNAYLGPEFTKGEICAACAKHERLELKQTQDPAFEAAGRIAQGQIVMWFQGRMEYGPRALGARSILALPNSPRIKDELNLSLKRRAWYQPFCPSILAAEERRLLAGSGDRFMTRACKGAHREELAGAVHVDGTCRPQIVDAADGAFCSLLTHLRALTGCGAVLNTSFNRHGEPIVCTPEDALRAFEETPIETMIIGDFVCSKKGER